MIYEQIERFTGIIHKKSLKPNLDYELEDLLGKLKVMLVYTSQDLSSHIDLTIQQISMSKNFKIFPQLENIGNQVDMDSMNSEKYVENFKKSVLNQRNDQYNTHCKLNNTSKVDEKTRCNNNKSKLQDSYIKVLGTENDLDDLDETISEEKKRDIEDEDDEDNNEGSEEDVNNNQGSEEDNNIEASEEDEGDVYKKEFQQYLEKLEQYVDKFNIVPSVNFKDKGYFIMRKKRSPGYVKHLNDDDKRFIHEFYKCNELSQRQLGQILQLNPKFISKAIVDYKEQQPTTSLPVKNVRAQRKPRQDYKSLNDSKADIESLLNASLTSQKSFLNTSTFTSNTSKKKVRFQNQALSQNVSQNTSFNQDNNLLNNSINCNNKFNSMLDTSINNSFSINKSFLSDNDTFSRNKEIKNSQPKKTANPQNQKKQKLEPSNMVSQDNVEIKIEESQMQIEIKSQTKVEKRQSAPAGNKNTEKKPQQSHKNKTNLNVNTNVNNNINNNNNQPSSPKIITVNKPPQVNQPYGSRQSNRIENNQKEVHKQRPNLSKIVSMPLKPKKIVQNGKAKVSQSSQSKK